MQRRSLTVLFALMLTAGAFAGTMMFGSAQNGEEPNGSPDSNYIVFPWVPNGSIVEDPRNDFGSTGPYYGTVTIQNLEDTRIDIFYTSTAEDDYDSEAVGGWESQKLNGYASVTLTAQQLGVDSPGSGVIVAGRHEGSSDPAQIAAVQKQAADVELDANARTSDDHKTVGGYSGLQPHQVGEEAVLPIVQINSNWNTIIHITNFNDEVTADVSVNMIPADGVGWSFPVNEEIEPGETLSIDLLELNPPAEWVGSAVIDASTSVAAVAERVKNETDMLIMNVSQNPEAAGGTQSAPLVFEEWFLWNTGISVANLSSESNEVVITYYDLDGEMMNEDELTLPGNGMTFVYRPAGLGDDDDDEIGFVGSAVITSEHPIVGAVDEVKYFGDLPDAGHAMSYMVELDVAEVGESLAMPLVQRGDFSPTYGDTTGIQLFNPTDESVTAALWYIGSDGAVFDDSPEIIALDAKEGHTAYTLDEGNMPVGFNGSAIIQVLSGEGGISAASNNVNYLVEHDGSASFNLLRTALAGPGVPESLIPDIGLESEPEGNNEGDTFELTAQLLDDFGNPMPLAGVDILFELNATGAQHAALFETGVTIGGDDSYMTSTDADGQAFVDVIRDEPESEDDWLEGGFSGMVRATIVGTDIEVTITLTWVEDD